MKKILIALTFVFSIFSFHICAQTDSVLVKGSGSALLDIQSDDKGILIPRLSTVDRTTTISSPATGLLVYDTDLNEFCYYDGNQWVCGWNKSTTSPVDTCFTLDEAYDCEVPGEGRVITVDAGAVTLNGSINGPSGALEVDNKGSGFVGRFTDKTADGLGSENDGHPWSGHGQRWPLRNFWGRKCQRCCPCLYQWHWKSRSF